jgi:hypothetical protein
MNRHLRRWLGWLLVMGLMAGFVVAQVGRDPLTRSEADQIREAADNPAQRIALFLQFAQDRLDQFQNKRKGNDFDRAGSMHQALQDYSGILEELDDNVDELVAGHVTGEMQGKIPKAEKPLRSIINAESKMLASLQNIQSTSSPADLSIYRYELADCLDATRDSLKNAQEGLVQAKQREEERKREKKQKRQQEKDEEKALHE